MKIYRGKRLGVSPDTCSDVSITVQQDDGTIKNLRHRVYHSPTGMNWGYAGSGPSDLALSILWDLYDTEPDMPFYMAFKHRFVAGWKEEWEITESDIRGWVLSYSYKNGRPECSLGNSTYPKWKESQK